MRIRRLFDEVNEWADRQFGHPRSPLGPLKHLKKEIDEVAADSSDVTEWADMLILILNGAHCAGFDIDILLDAAFDKMEINRNRAWGKPDADGVVEHIRTGPEIKAKQALMGMACKRCNEIYRSITMPFRNDIVIPEDHDSTCPLRGNKGAKYEQSDPVQQPYKESSIGQPANGAGGRGDGSTQHGGHEQRSAEALIDESSRRRVVEERQVPEALAPASASRLRVSGETPDGPSEGASPENTKAAGVGA